jgi:hypothetical protein
MSDGRIIYRERVARQGSETYQGTPYRSIRTVQTVQVAESGTPERAVEQSTRAEQETMREHPAVADRQASFKPSSRAEAEDRIGAD